jgi:hypothetical protein
VTFGACSIFAGVPIRSAYKTEGAHNSSRADQSPRVGEELSGQEDERHQRHTGHAEGKSQAFH